MKKLHKILLTLSFIFAVGLSAGLFFIFYENNQIVDDKPGNIQIADAATTYIYINITSEEYESGKSSGTVSVTGYYYQLNDSSGHNLGTKTVTQGSSPKYSGSVSYSTTVLGHKERHVRVKVSTTLSNTWIYSVSITGSGSGGSSNSANSNVTSSGNIDCGFNASSNSASTTVNINVKYWYGFIVRSDSGSSTSYRCSADGLYGIFPVSNYNKNGYTLKGFYTASSGGTLAIDSSGNFKLTYKEVRNRTLYPQYDAKEYTVNLNNQSATTAGTTLTTAKTGNAMPSITVPKKTGYIFGGYYTGTNGSGTQYYNSNGTSAKALAYSDLSGNTLYLYAKWTPIKYNVAFNANGGEGSISNMTNLVYDQSYTLTSIPSSFKKTGYTFAGWATTADGPVAYSNGATIKNLKSGDGETQTLYAKWTANNYTVQFDSNGGNGSMSNQSFTYDSSQNLSTNVFKRRGYVFLGWSLSKLNPLTTYNSSSITYSDGQSVLNLATSGTVTLYAVWLETWSAHASASLAQNSDGSYIISSPEDLAYLSNHFNSGANIIRGAKFILTQNLDLSRYYFVPIGSSKTQIGSSTWASNFFYENVFDGQGHVISGLKIGDFYECAGLFGGISNNAIVENLILDEIDIVNTKNNGDVGGITGVLYYESVIKNCEVRSGTIRGKNVGGIAGEIRTGGQVYNCVNRANVKATCAGGIFYSLSQTSGYPDSQVYGCVNYGRVEGTQYCGGVGGILTNNSTLKNCINYGDTVSSSCVGGIVGVAYNGVSIISCANYGSLTKYNTGRLGGILGKTNSSSDEITIMYCSSVGTWSGFPVGTYNYIHGGDASGLIKGCYVRAVLASSVGSSALSVHEYAYGTAEDFNTGFRYVAGMNNNLPMQVELFPYAQQMPEQSDVLSVGLDRFKIVEY